MIASIDKLEYSNLVMIEFRIGYEKPRK